MNRPTLGGIVYMRAAAKLGREIPHPHHTDDVTIFFAEERHRAQLLRLVDGHLRRRNGRPSEDLLIDEQFNPLQLVGP